MTTGAYSLSITAAQLETWWLCWLDGRPILALPQSQCESWLRKRTTDYLRKSISPWAMLPEPAKVKIAAQLGLEVL